MNLQIKNQLISIATERISDTDVSHDIHHALRVLSNTEMIAETEGGDCDIIIPAALFHDLIVYPKNHPDKHRSQEESALQAEKILRSIHEYPQDKIKHVTMCIRECSFSKGIVPGLLESKILQDADGLEATGAISIMRTYSSTGQMQWPFYNATDPFREKRQPDPSRFALDLFYKRLLKVTERMHTKTAQKIAKRRTDFLHDFLAEFKLELEGK